jgi:acetate kinase
MKILAINSGSASLKFKLFEESADGFKVLAEGQFKHYNETSFLFEFTDFLPAGRHGKSHDVKIDIAQSQWDNRVEQIFKSFLTSSTLKDISEIDIVVHRIVHGAEKYTEATLITQEVLRDLEKNFNELAPLHNPFQTKIIEEIIQRYPDIKQVGVFDTAFNSTMPEINYLYGLPYEYYEKYKVRRYGFHGISHKYVSEKVIDILRSKDQKVVAKVLEKGQNGKVRDIRIVSCHLGSGSSVCAIDGYNVVDNSFGFSPNENLITSTRVGEVDYDALVFLKKKLKLGDAEIEEIISKKSGLLGISEYSEDMKILLKDYDRNENAKLAIDLYVSDIVKYIASYIVELSGIDVLIFTGGIGSGSPQVRQMITDKLLLLGIVIDKAKNTIGVDVEDTLNITGGNSKIQVWVIHTDEELQMVKEATTMKN